MSQKEKQISWQECVQLNRLTYNATASSYLRDRKGFRSTKWLDKFNRYLPQRAEILDLGCGAGVPIDDWLAKKGHLVTGLDFSDQQLALARLSCKNASYVQKDLLTLQNSEYSVDGIVALYTLFHLPRKKHLTILQTWASYLPVRGVMLISMGESDFEGWHDFYGQRVWSSQFHWQTNQQMLEKVGFTILEAKLEHSNQETHWIALAQKQ